MAMKFFFKSCNHLKAAGGHEFSPSFDVPSVSAKYPDTQQEGGTP